MLEGFAVSMLFREPAKGNGFVYLNHPFFPNRAAA
jgi:hypothetical protein